jgi:hypothetical protein
MAKAVKEASVADKAKKRTRRTWPNKQPLSKFIEALGLKLKPSEALAKVLAAGYDGANIQHVHRAQSALRRRVSGTNVAPLRAQRTARRTRRQALNEDERSFVALALKLGEERARALMQRVSHLRGMLGL